MVEVGEITEAQFNALELADGRLEDGVSVDVLFYSKEKEFVELLGGVNDSNFEDRMVDIQTEIVNSRDRDHIENCRKAVAAIQFRYVKPMEEQQALEQQMLLSGKFNQEEDPNKPAKPDESYQQEKFGRKLPRQTVRIPDEEQNYQED
jgi:hypothetical protein